MKSSWQDLFAHIIPVSRDWFRDSFMSYWVTLKLLSLAMIFNCAVWFRFQSFVYSEPMKLPHSTDLAMTCSMSKSCQPHPYPVQELSCLNYIANFRLGDGPRLKQIYHRPVLGNLFISFRRHLKTASRAYIDPKLPMHSINKLFAKDFDVFVSVAM